MNCPTCGAVLARARCPVCDPEWAGLFDFDSDTSNAEAKIIGDLSLDWDDPSVIPGAVARPDGQVGARLLYIAHDSSRPLLDPEAVPQRRGELPLSALTPLEDALYESVDGEKTVLALSEESGLPDKDFVSAMLSLIDCGALVLRRPLARPPSPAELEALSESVDLAEVPPELAVTDLEELPAPELPPPRAKVGLPPVTRSASQAEVQPRPTSSSSSNVKLPAAKEVTRPASGAHAIGAVSRVSQAQKLYEQALRDRDAGNVISAQMNMKLALSFDRQNTVLQRALNELMQLRPPQPKTILDPVAMKLFEDAAKKETENLIDAAIVLLEEALAISEEAPILNRLGVVVAIRKRDFVRGRELIQRALAADPYNPTYKQNLDKLENAERARAAKRGAKQPKKEPPPPQSKPGLLSFLRWRR